MPSAQSPASAKFPANFAWGAATASYQIEGGWDADGKGPSIWDQFCREPGKIGTTYMWAPADGRVACDHYHRWPEDVELLRGLGTNAYRFSLSWPRILPEGTGAINEAGLDFYDRLVDRLLAAGVDPWITLYHWDLPLSLHHRGGWLNRDITDWFSDYAGIVGRRLGDRVKHWMTWNEPQCFVWLAYGCGAHAPGYKLGMGEVIKAAHHALLAHGKAVQTLRSACRQPATIGLAPVGVSKIPYTSSPADIEAARRATFATAGDSLWTNAWWLEPVFKGRYPEEGLAHWGRHLGCVLPGDMEQIAQPVDFLGINTYNGELVRAGAEGKPEVVTYPAGSPISAFKWMIAPDALYWTPRFLHEHYGVPIVITENGLSGADWVHEDGRVPDPGRIDFTRRYLRALRRAIADGTPVLGYFHWTLMDNFEWCEGYKERFGLIHVDYATQCRTPKDSYYWYRDVIADRGGRSLDAPAASG